MRYPDNRAKSYALGHSFTLGGLRFKLVKVRRDTLPDGFKARRLTWRTVCHKCHNRLETVTGDPPDRRQLLATCKACRGPGVLATAHALGMKKYRMVKARRAGLIRNS